MALGAQVQFKQMTKRQNQSWNGLELTWVNEH